MLHVLERYAEFLMHAYECIGSNQYIFMHTQIDISIYHL